MPQNLLQVSGMAFAYSTKAAFITIKAFVEMNIKYVASLLYIERLLEYILKRSKGTSHALKFESV